MSLSFNRPMSPYACDACFPIYRKEGQYYEYREIVERKETEEKIILTLKCPHCHRREKVVIAKKPD